MGLPILGRKAHCFEIDVLISIVIKQLFNSLMPLRLGSDPFQEIATDEEKCRCSIIDKRRLARSFLLRMNPFMKLL
jgi:hypothetical protein